MYDCGILGKPAGLHLSVFIVEWAMTPCLQSSQVL